MMLGQRSLKVVCYVFGDEFISTLVSFALPSFLNSHKASGSKLRPHFVFTTRRNDLEKLQVALNAFNLSAEIRCSEESYVYRKMHSGHSHIDFWDRELYLANEDYVFFLIPDNLYSVDFCGKLYEAGERNDFVINYPGYVAKEPFLEDHKNLKELIDGGSLDHVFMNQRFLDYAHPLNWSWWLKNPLGLSNYHHEVVIQQVNEGFAFFNLAEHPIFFNLRRCPYRKYNFMTPGPPGMKAEFLTMLSLSVDSIINQVRMIKSASLRADLHHWYIIVFLAMNANKVCDDQHIQRSWLTTPNGGRMIDNSLCYQKIRMGFMETLSYYKGTHQSVNSLEAVISHVLNDLDLPPEELSVKLIGILASPERPMRDDGLLNYIVRKLKNNLKRIKFKFRQQGLMVYMKKKFRRLPRQVLSWPLKTGFKMLNVVGLPVHYPRSSFFMAVRKMLSLIRTRIYLAGRKAGFFVPRYRALTMDGSKLRNHITLEETVAFYGAKLEAAGAPPALGARTAWYIMRAFKHGRGSYMSSPEGSAYLQQFAGKDAMQIPGYAYVCARRAKESFFIRLFQ